MMVVICPAAFNPSEVDRALTICSGEGIPGNPWSEDPPLRSLETPGSDPYTERDAQNWLSKGKMWWDPEHHLHCHAPRGERAGSSSAVGKQLKFQSPAAALCTTQSLRFLT